MTSAKPATASLTEESRARIEQRICNWADWQAQRESGPGECGSAESRYRAPKDSESLVAAARSQAIDVDDALKVEKAITLLHPTQRRYIVMRYRNLRTLSRVQAALGYRPEQQAAMHQLVLLSLIEQLTRVDRARHSDLLIARGAPIWAGIARR